MGGALWPPRIDEAPNDAQEGVATEGRPYGAFYESAGESPNVLLIEESKRATFLEIANHRFVPFILSFENKLDHFAYGASSASALGDDV